MSKSYFPPDPGLAPMQRYLRRRRRRKEQDVRPPPHWFTLGTLRSFGTRMFNPPPPVSEERYIWYLLPRYSIQLEDVVADKHLSPLSRQEFEDYLQHVDGTVGNLYFCDWLNHYRERYQEWAKSVLPTHSTASSSRALDLNIPSTSSGIYRTRDLWYRLKDCQDRQLREEFAFARATFFEPKSSMRVSISDETRAAVLSIPNAPPPHEHQALTDKLPSFPGQPEPSLFDEVLAQVNLALAAAFAKFLRLAFCNSGLWHSCIGHAVGVGILAAGLSLWCMGIASAGRGHIAGGLPLIWIGVWFMLVSANGHCLGVYVTGDARQLYPHELDRPIAPGVVPPPPIYSLALPPAPEDTESQSQPSTYSFTRKASTVSHLLPFTAPPTPPAKTYQPFRWAYCNNGRRQSDGAIAIPRRGAVDFSRPRDEEVYELDRIVKQPTEIELKLPPPRQTKDLPRQSLVIDVQQTSSGPTFLPLAVPTSSARRSAVVDLSDGWDFGAEGRPDSPFSEENDFGIVISEAFEEDMPYHPAEPTLHEEASKPGWSVEPLAPLVPVPDSQRRRTLPELFAHSAKGSVSGLGETASRRGSKSSEAEREIRTQWPWPRKLFGAMTPVRSPIVRRAHWVMTVRTAIVASVVTLGMAFGFVR